MPRRQHTIIVSHGHCPDGCAAVTIARKLNKSTEYVSGQHDRIDEQVQKAADRLQENGKLLITDITCGEDTLKGVCKTLKDKNAELGIYEHHISRSFLKDFTLPEDLNGEIVFDLNRCGSKIFYDTMKEKHPDQLENFNSFIELINDRDLWLNKDARSAELSSLHSIYGDDRFINRFLKNPSPDFSPEEILLLNYEKESQSKRIHRLMNKINIHTDKDGLRYGIMIGEGKASEVCNAALDKHNLEYVCLVDFNEARVSIRSASVFDCAKFSSERGGGGHARAGGFPLPKTDFQLYSPEEKL